MIVDVELEPELEQAVAAVATGVAFAASVLVAELGTALGIGRTAFAAAQKQGQD